MDRVVNCTPHDIVVYDKRDIYMDDSTRTYRLKDKARSRLTLPPSPWAARCSRKDVVTEYIEGIPTFTTQFTDVKDLPSPERGVWYVVSSIVAQSAKSMGRTDCLIPHHIVRDDHGRIIGCAAFSRV